MNKNSSNKNATSVASLTVKKKAVFKIKTVRFSKDISGKNTFPEKKFKNIKLQDLFKIFI